MYVSVLRVSVSTPSSFSVVHPCRLALSYLSCLLRVLSCCAAAMEDDEARQLKEVLKETGNRRRHRTNTSSTSSTSQPSSNPTSASHSRTSSLHDSIYPDLSQHASTTTAPFAAVQSASSSSSPGSSTPFSGGWKPASSPFTGAPIAQPISYHPPAQPVHQQRTQSVEQDYVMVDDEDDNAQSTDLSHILRRHSLTNTQPSTSPSTAPPPPLNPRLSGDMRYAQQLQDEEEKLAKQEEEDRKKAEELAKQEEDDRKFAELLQRREEFEAGQAGDHDSDEHEFAPPTLPIRSRPTSRPASSSAIGWSGTLGPFSVSVGAGSSGAGGVGSREHMFSEHELRAQLVQRLQRSGLLQHSGGLFGLHHSAIDAADDYDDDMHSHGRFRPVPSAFLSHGFSPFAFHGQPDVDNMSYDELLELSERIGQVKPKGMAAEQLSVLPTWRWKGPAADSASANDEKDEKRSGKSADNDASCSICLTPYDTGEEIKRLPCMRQRIYTPCRTTASLWHCGQRVPTLSTMFCVWVCGVDGGRHVPCGVHRSMAGTEREVPSQPTSPAHTLLGAHC